jgi:hypothetical protein
VTLSEKQLRALRAVAEPRSAHAAIFWADARASWQGPRKTLGSLVARGLVEYDERKDGYWHITDAGREAWRAVPRGMARRARRRALDSRHCGSWTRAGANTPAPNTPGTPCKGACGPRCPFRGPWYP